MNDKLWSDICLRFRRFLLDRLSKLPVGQPPHKINMNSYKRLEYVQSLCAFTPVEEIWPRYRTIRTHQVDGCLSTRSSQEESPPFLESVKTFEIACQKICVMITEDFELLNSGVFANVTSFFKAIQEIYLDRLQDEVSTLVDGLLEEITSNQDKPSQKEKPPKELPKSTSEFVKLGALKGNLRRQQSKSLDSLYDKNGDPFSDLQGILPGSQLQV